MKISKESMLISIVCLVSLILIICICSGVIPFGIRGQWIYPSLQQFNIVEIPIMHMLGSIIIAVGIFIISFRTKKYFSKSHLTAISGIIVLSLSSMLFDWNILLSGRIGIAENLMALYDDATTGYLEEASKAGSFANYIENFAEKQKKMNL